MFTKCIIFSNFNKRHYIYLNLVYSENGEGGEEVPSPFFIASGFGDGGSRLIQYVQVSAYFVKQELLKFFLSEHPPPFFE